LIKHVLVTGATGFVGWSVVRAMLARGLTPVCLVRSEAKLLRQHPEVAPDRLVPVVGALSDEGALRDAAQRSQAAIHLVGIISQRRLKGQTFAGIHTKGTRRVVDAVLRAGIKRYTHMSALGTRADAVSVYHRTKWEAEQCVRGSSLDWTIFQPSLIHGPRGEFMQLMRRIICGLAPPVIPYFGAGEAKVQPVSVKDVAHCMVESLLRADTIGKVFQLGGPRVHSWKELYATCRALIPRARAWKPMVSLPVPVAKVAAALSGPPLALAELVAPSLGMLRFDSGHVQMSQEDSVCDHTCAERAFDITMRSFEEDLAVYADQIG
jgi:NADH dehydrogenase